MSITFKAENDWRDVGPPLSCSASQLPSFLVQLVFETMYRWHRHNVSLFWVRI